MDIPNILRFMHPDAIWSVGEDYDSLRWPEQVVNKPTLEEITEAETGYNEKIIFNSFKISVQSLIEKVAEYKQYQSALHCTSYATSTNIQWKAEAQVFIAWRDAVWNYLYAQLVLIMNKTRPIPTVAQLNAELPVIQWPI